MFLDYEKQQTNKQIEARNEQASALVLHRRNKLFQLTNKFLFAKNKINFVLLLANQKFLRCLWIQDSHFVERYIRRCSAGREIPEHCHSSCVILYSMVCCFSNPCFNIPTWYCCGKQGYVVSCNKLSREFYEIPGNLGSISSLNKNILGKTNNGIDVSHHEQFIWKKCLDHFN